MTPTVCGEQGRPRGRIGRRQLKNVRIVVDFEVRIGQYVWLKLLYEHLFNCSLVLLQGTLNALNETNNALT